jgi:hypothetical protein
MAATVNCTYCNSELPENSHYCNNCGKDISKPQATSKPRTNKYIVLIFVFIGVVAIVLLGWAFLYGPYGGPPNELIITDHQYILDHLNQTVQIINKSRCSDLPAEVKAMGISDVWIVGIKEDGPYAITAVYAKQNGEWREIKSSDECP